MVRLILLLGVKLYTGYILILRLTKHISSPNRFLSQSKLMSE